ncbi:hypothetical protein E1B28_005253 [Marasmius oreades]|uniref:F-box domain-containing protein n=1 Tax=Marasmius oreades TaxID=181124 RepID=A0A9P7V0E3_9AGAR|nr:uncharacterized protein E1B28_005253 [Marasmius oreades]KAG7097942.1 hypothetical protein E1B28_005253 [Marasmius oreades]
MSSSGSIVVPSSKKRGPVSLKGKALAKGVLLTSGTSSTSAPSKRGQRKAQLSVNTNLASYDRKDPFQAFNILLKLIGSLSSRVGGCQYKFSPEEHKLSIHLLGIVEPFIGSSAPSRRTLITRQPTEILDAIAFQVESREDLRNLALSCHRMHSIVAPRHIEYRIIRSKVSSISLWNHLIVNRSLAKNVRRLEVMDERSSQREIIPNGITASDTDLESTDDEIGVRGIHLKQEKFLVGALNRMMYLIQFVWNSNHSPISIDRVWPTLLNTPSLRDIEINDNLVFSPLATVEESDESDEEGSVSVSRGNAEQQRKELPALKTVALRSTRHVYGSTKHPELTRAKGLLNSCPNLENLEITYTPARSQAGLVPAAAHLLPAEEFLLVGRWPQLRSLSLTNLRCTSLTGLDPTSLFILAHLNLEILHLDVVPRMTQPVLPPNALPRLREVKACKEIVGAILECPYEEGSARPLEVIKGICLSRSTASPMHLNNPNVLFLDRLKRFGGDTLKRIELVGWSEMEDIKRLVDSAPKLVWLDIGKRNPNPSSSGTTSVGVIAHSQVVDWAMLLSGLPDLTTFHGVKFFYEVSSSMGASASAADKSRIRKNDESASVLTWKCPKLRRVDCWDEGPSLKVVVLIKEGRDVRWEVRRVRG